MDIAVVFADVRGSTSLGARMDPNAFAVLMNRFYQATTRVLLARGAVIDKMIGDEVMALFIPGLCGREYRALAAEACEALMRAVAYGSLEEPWLSLGVAAHAGPAFVGNVGGEGVTDFTALGDTVNMAAHLQQEAAVGEALLSEAVCEGLTGRFQQLERRVIRLQGRDEPVPVRVLRPGT